MHRPDTPPTRLWPLLVGGFLGPFGGAMVTPILPEVSAGLGTSLSTAAWSLTAYMIPFAGLLMVSGTLGERWGRGRTVRMAYLAYAAASLVCVFAPSAVPFLAGRGLQGAANAFTSPLLVAAISDAVPPDRLGRSLGRFASWQAAGQAFAPLVGGFAASVDYRWAFALTALAAAGLAALPPEDAAVNRPRGDDPTGWRALANARLATASAVAFGLYLSTTALLLLVALRADDRFGLDPTARGLLIGVFGLAGLLTAARIGRLADRHGLQMFGIGCVLGFAITVVAAGLVPTVILLAVMVAAGGTTSTAGRIVVNALAVRSTPGNRGGAASLALAWQFLGSALAPVIMLPVYRANASLAFAVAAAVLLPAAVLLARDSA